ncbi:hypothetical protein PN836_005045 [Ningiella sp. W23]|uniref:hypothetical protein n=1 Tax=Ningiella sp. W23 TaxID=3023715 RepID=UPI0037567415
MQTYVGVVPSAEASLNAHCVPVSLNPKLQQRERDYQFTEVKRDAVNLLNCHNQALGAHLDDADITLWICESLAVHDATPQYPINLSYIDTCLAGCLSHYKSPNAGYEHAERFMQSTFGWQHVYDDRNAPRYPRRAQISMQQYKTIDALLQQFQVL